MAKDPFLSIGMGGDSGAASRMEAFNATLRMMGWADAIGVAVEHELKSASPVVTGKLRDSIAYERVSRVGGVQLKFHSNDAAARYVTQGTRPHPIEARNALMLHFTARDGREVFTRSVNHPGIATPNNFPQKVMDKMLPAITVSFAALFERI